MVQNHVLIKSVSYEKDKTPNSEMEKDIKTHEKIQRGLT